MAFSATYIAIEAMFQQGCVMMNIAEFEWHLGLLVEKGMICPAEQDDLLKPAGELNLDLFPSHESTTDRNAFMY